MPKDRLEAAVLTQLADLHRDGHLSAKPSKKASSRPRSARNASVATVSASKPSVSRELPQPPAGHTGARTADGADLAGLADQLENVIAKGSPEQARELLRLLVKEIRVHDRRRIISTYRIPAAVRGIPRKVGRTGHYANRLTDAELEGRPLAIA